MVIELCFLLLHFYYDSKVDFIILFLSDIERDTSVQISDRRQLLLKKFESVQAENIDLKRQLKVVQKRLKDLYDRDSHDKQGEIFY